MIREARELGIKGKLETHDGGYGGRLGKLSSRYPIVKRLLPHEAEYTVETALRVRLQAERHLLNIAWLYTLHGSALHAAHGSCKQHNA